MNYYYQSLNINKVVNIHDAVKQNKIRTFIFLIYS